MRTRSEDTKVFELSAALRSAWSSKDFGELSTAVEGFSAERSRLVPDWKMAMVIYHVPDWYCEPLDALPVNGGRRLVEVLTDARRALAELLSQMFCDVLCRRFTFGPDALLVNEGRAHVLSPSLRDELAASSDFQAQASVISRGIDRVFLATVEEIVPVFNSSHVTRRLVSECVSYGNLVRTIVERDPTYYMSSFDDLRTLASVFSSAGKAGVDVILKCVAVLSQRCAIDGVRIEESVIQQLFSDDGLICLLASIDAERSALVARYLSGCTAECYRSDSGSPHDYLRSQLLGVEQFQDLHAQLAQFLAERVRLNEKNLELADPAGWQDPLTGEPLSRLESSEGCPVRSHEGFDRLTALLGRVLQTDVVVSKLAQAEVMGGGAQPHPRVRL